MESRASKKGDRPPCSTRFGLAAMQRGSAMIYISIRRSDCIWRTAVVGADGRPFGRPERNAGRGPAKVALTRDCDVVTVAGKDDNLQPVKNGLGCAL